MRECESTACLIIQRSPTQFSTLYLEEAVKRGQKCFEKGKEDETVKKSQGWLFVYATRKKKERAVGVDAFAPIFVTLDLSAFPKKERGKGFVCILRAARISPSPPSEPTRK